MVYAFGIRSTLEQASIYILAERYYLYYYWNATFLISFLNSTRFLQLSVPPLISRLKLAIMGKSLRLWKEDQDPGSAPGVEIILISAKILFHGRFC